MTYYAANYLGVSQQEALKVVNMWVNHLLTDFSRVNWAYVHRWLVHRQGFSCQVPLLSLSLNESFYFIIAEIIIKHWRRKVLNHTYNNQTTNMVWLFTKFGAIITADMFITFEICPHNIIKRVSLQLTSFFTTSTSLHCSVVTLFAWSSLHCTAIDERVAPVHSFTAVHVDMFFGWIYNVTANEWTVGFFNWNYFWL